MIGVTEPRCSEEVQRTLKSLVESVPDAFFILAGTMKYDEAKREYKTGWFDTPDENSALALGVALPSGGRDRVLAAVEMHRVFPEAYLVPMSRARDEHKPTYASITQKELLEAGVDTRRIVLQDVPVDTVTELKEAARLSMERGWSNIVLIISRWQLPRAEALLNHIEDFADDDDEKKLLSSFADAIRESILLVQFLNTTDVLSTISDAHRHFFKEALAVDPGMQARIAAEEKSIRQIREGTYGGRMLTHRIWEGKP